MPATGSSFRRLRVLALVWIDALVYAFAVTLVTTAGALVVGIATGGGFVRAKAVLFLAGFLLLGYATFRLWPSSPSDLEPGPEGATGGGTSLAAAPEETRFQTFVRTLPPLRWLRPPPPERRMTTAGKLLVGSLFVLLASYLMEVILGVT